jgi:transcription-repair coupling factor (superfamily II helicase)
MELNKIVSTHPEYSRLLTHLKSEQDDTAILFPTIEIAGIPFTLQQELIDQLSIDLNKSIIFASRDSLEVRKFLQTVQEIDLNKTDQEMLTAILRNHNFKRVPKISSVGEYAVAGDIVSFWPAGFEHPVRASYFGKSFESGSVFDEIYGRKYLSVHSFPIGDLKTLETRFSVSNIQSSTSDKQLLKLSLIFGGDNLDTYQSEQNFKFDLAYPQIYFQRFDLLLSEIKNKTTSGYHYQIYTDHKQELPIKLQKYCFPANEKLEAGLVSELLKLTILTDRELFGTIFLNKITKRLTSDKARKMLAELEGEIEINDYIVHEDHGIGIYRGIKQEKYEQKVPLGFGQFKTNVIYEDYILISYAEGDELYVPISQIYKITKYIATDTGSPVLTRLGRNEWQILKKKAKADIEKMARELVNLYAQRELAHAPKIEVTDTEDYKLFLEQFTYEVTTDQLRAEKEILFDLKDSKPMNRLIVGDVGFGKTEVAMRAAFKVCEAGYQVAVLCPTTVLAAQHEKVFTDRFSGFPFKIASLSRLTHFDNKTVAEELQLGKVDIVIGTHRLLSEDIGFKKLGLVIIDEEQKFGVKQKEKLKKLEYGVHLLTLSATPIPRTLSMALSAIQEISLIQTPPKNRKNIKTYVAKINWQEVIAAIDFEIKRNGQVYFLHNRVETISSTFEKLHKLMPGVKFALAHGQMNPDELSRTMKDFYNHEYDCLICTTIIENGLDMPNVNTIIIEHAQNFGLGQLYQLRGRVGRSDKQAFAYLFYEGDDIAHKDIENPDQDPVKHPKDTEHDYKKRLKALIESQELGSGFKLASRDLEIRGAGNLLGKQQHGNIKYMGYGLYMQLLAEEIEKLKNINNETV